MAKTKMPPGPGMTPATGDRMIRTTPMAKIDHSVTGWSMNHRHCLRVNMGRDVGRDPPVGKCLLTPPAPLASALPS